LKEKEPHSFKMTFADCSFFHSFLILWLRAAGTSRDEGSIQGKVARKYLAKCTVEKAEHKPTHRACEYL
jgi:hypothetical protein